ncbi:hypothetical protein J4760_09895 [Salinicoccus sp. ID82-1]|uniref:Hemerythrin-like domain-containing protein n=1 Tax=Salinicoccus cyprini TaxID=2493691 RepID=A0A558AVK8_9STAP|nr:MULTISPECIES: hypothetical protein [Salinicoccus]MCG1010328.1 hypothetical protein [Salinicoccus sp. ID82-1]TVT28281.1 hypothetical protein FO441_07675 [Salinicoccus cyprini]
MAGPALRQLHAHRAIHDASLGGAEDHVTDMKTLLNKQEHEALAEEMQSFIEYVEQRILAHAESEEEENGLYQEAVDKNPALHDKVQQLTRDHDLMRNMIERMRTELSKEAVDFQKLIDYSVSIIIVDEIHSRDEEQFLLDD